MSRARETETQGRGRILNGRRNHENQPPDDSGVGEVLKNRPFLLLWLAQLSTQVGGNMVLYGLTVIISSRYSSATAVSALLLSFLVPAVVFSAIAGVYVDQVDRRLVLVVTNILRGIAFAGVVVAGNNLLLIYPLVVFVSTVTTFFGPAEASMIPILVPRRQLLAANGLFTLTMNAAFAAGFALFGPFLVSLSSATILIVVVAILYFVAAALCWTLPAAPPTGDNGLTAGRAVADAERAVESMIAQLGEGIDYIRKNRNIGWSLTYLGIAASLIGVLGVLGPGFAKESLGLVRDKDFVVVVLPLGLGIVTGILALNAYGRYLPRRRMIEAGLIALGALLAVLSIAGPLSRFLEGSVPANNLQDVSRALSVLGIVIAVGFLAGIAYIFVAVPAQTQLQEDLPEDVRGRIFGILNMLVSIASFLPIIVVAPIADVLGPPPVIFVVAVFVLLSGIASVVSRGALGKLELMAHTTSGSTSPVDPLTVAMGGSELGHARHDEAPGGLEAAAQGEPIAPGRVGDEPEAGPGERVGQPEHDEPHHDEPHHDVPQRDEAASYEPERDDDPAGYEPPRQTSWLEGSADPAPDRREGALDVAVVEPSATLPPVPNTLTGSSTTSSSPPARHGQHWRRRPRGVIRRSPLDPEWDDREHWWSAVARLPRTLLRRVRGQPEEED